MLHTIDTNIDLYYIVREKPDGKNSPGYTTSFGYRDPPQKSPLNSASKIQLHMNTKVKKALNLNRTWLFASVPVKDNLRTDLMKPVTHIGKLRLFQFLVDSNFFTRIYIAVERLLNETNLKVFVYNGQYDFIVPIYGTVTWVENLKWSGTESWKNLQRKPFVVDNIVEGFVKEYGKLKMYWINRAGHMVIFFLLTISI